MNTQPIAAKPQNGKPPTQPAAPAQDAPPKEENQSLRDFLHKNSSRIKTIAHERMNDDKALARLLDIASMLVHRDPKGNLQKCTYASVFNSIRDCARLGLTIGGARPQGYLIPYKTECTFQVSYFGLIALMRRSGEVTDVRAHVVHKGDAFDYELGLNPYCKHKPHDGEHAKGDWTHVYSIIKVKGADPLVDVMTKGEVFMIRARSKAAGEGPWVTDEEEMARKTVTRRNSKYAPMPEDLEEQFAREDAIEGEVLSRTETPKGNEGLEAALQLAPTTPKERIETPATRETVPVAAPAAAQSPMREPGDDDEEDSTLVVNGKPL